MDIKPTCQGAATHKNKRQDQQALGESKGNNLPFQQGVPLKGKEETPRVEDLCREVLMVRIEEIHETLDEDDPMERIDLLNYNSRDYDEFLSEDNIDPAAKETETKSHQLQLSTCSLGPQGHRGNKG